MINDSDAAVERVAAGKFAFYENIHFLQQIALQRQAKFQEQHQDLNATSSDLQKTERNLHIMRDCVINMPISIGLQRNSPIKLRMDRFIRRVLEAGLVAKWLNDVMQETTSAKISDDKKSIGAVMNMRKFFGALVALFIGYAVGITALIIEVVYFHCFVKKNNSLFNKYSKLFYRKNN